MITMVMLTLFFAVPVAILVLALAPQAGRKLWFAHWPYAAGAIAGGVIFLGIATAAFPLVASAYEAYERWMENLLTKVAGTNTTLSFMMLMPACNGLLLWYLGMAAGIWVVRRDREKDRK